MTSQVEVSNKQKQKGTHRSKHPRRVSAEETRVNAWVESDEFQVKLSEADEQEINRLFPQKFPHTTTSLRVWTQRDKHTGEVLSQGMEPVTRTKQVTALHFLKEAGAEYNQLRSHLSKQASAKEVECALNDLYQRIEALEALLSRRKGLDDNTRCVLMSAAWSSMSLNYYEMESALKKQLSDWRIVSLLARGELKKQSERRRKEPFKTLAKFLFDRLDGLDIEITSGRDGNFLPMLVIFLEAIYGKVPSRVDRIASAAISEGRAFQRLRTGAKPQKRQIAPRKTRRK